MTVYEFMLLLGSIKLIVVFPQGLRQENDQRREREWLLVVLIDFIILYRFDPVNGILCLEHHGVICVMQQQDGVLKKFCPAHLVDSEIKANVTCAVYNHDGTGMTLSFLALEFSFDYYSHCIISPIQQRSLEPTMTKTFICLTTTTATVQVMFINTLDIATIRLVSCPFW